MERILSVLIILLFMPLCAYSIEAVENVEDIQNAEKLEEIELDETQSEQLNFIPQKKEKKVYFDEEDKLKLHLEGHLLKELKLGAVYNGNFGLEFLSRPSENHFEYDANYLDTWIEGKFKNDKTSFKVNVNPLRYVPKRPYIATLFQDVWLKHEFNEHQSLMAGYYRTPNGEEGSISAYDQDFISRSQIARTFANARATGVKNSGRYKYFDYDLGVFDSARYFDTCCQGFEVVAKATVKPLEFADGKYGHLKIAGSMNSGKRDVSYTVVNAYVGYEYKKLTLEAEYAHADGYNGPVSSSNAKAQGVYTSLKYALTPKLDVVARYDIFDPNLHISNNNVEEYTVGINYYPFGKKRIKLCLNYVYCQNHAKSSSNKLVLVTQFRI